MLYDKNIKDTNWIIIKLENMEEIVLEKANFNGANVLLFHFPKSYSHDNNIVLANGLEFHLGSNKLIFFCEQIELLKDSINIHILAIPYKIAKQDISEDGKKTYNMTILYTDDMDSIIHIDSGVEKINADSNLWVELLNSGIIYGEEDVLKQYDVLPKSRLYYKDENGNKKIKKYIK